MRTRKLAAAAAVALAATLAGCGSTGQNTAAGTQSAAPAAVSYGVVESVQPVQSGSRGPGLGAVAGGVLGGVLGNQVGGGRGNTAATAAGAIGGAVVGNQVEQRNRAQTNAWQLGIRLDNGGYQSVTQDSVGDITVGNRVRVENGRAYRY